MFGFALLAATGHPADTPPGLTSEPFARRAPRTPGTTLFTELAAEQIGIVAPNNFADPEMWGRRYTEFTLGPIGTGVAIGDYDSDGRPDVFVAGKSDPDRLFRNLGDWRFEDVSAAAGVSGPTDAWKTGACFVDVNNDGRLDLFVCRVNAPNLLYVNQGNGTFVERAHEAGLALVESSGMAAFGDYDRDGWLDFYLVTNLLDAGREPDGQPDYLFHNRGDGSFIDVTQKAGISGKAAGHAAMWWDYDNDHWPDLYVTNDYGWPDQLWRNQGDGTFRNTLADVVPLVPRFAMGADLGDVNNDGLIDFYVADMMPRSRAWDQRTLIDPRARLVDVAAPGVVPQYMRNALFLNTDTGRTLEAAYLAGLAATDWTWSVRFEDLDNDGHLDLHVTNGMIRPFWEMDRWRTHDGMTKAEFQRRVKAAPAQRERNLAFRNLGGLQFADVSAAWGLDQLGISFGAAFGDLDGDGDLDLVFSNYQGNVTVCRNDSDAGHRVTMDLRGVVSNRFGVGATVRLDTAAGVLVRQLASARGYLSSSELTLHFGLGDTARIERATITWPSGVVQTMGSLEVDRRYTITEPAPARVPPPRPPASGPREAEAQFVEVGAVVKLDVTLNEKPMEELAAQPLLPLRQNSPGPGVAVGDINGDGLDDVVFGGTSVEPARALVAQSDGTFAPLPMDALANASGVADAAPLLLDANGDGRTDLFLAKSGVAKPAGDAAYQARLFLNEGRGRFVSAPSGAVPAFTSSAGSVVAADFNRDGHLDIFIGGRLVPGDYPHTPRSALLLNRGGTFTDATDELAPGLAGAGMVAAALWTDVDDDGWIDLLLAVHWGEIQYWRNLEGKRFENASERFGFARAGTGWWTSLAAADFNGDGRFDYVAGNVGLNTPYQASPAEPLTLFTGAFDGSGRTHLIETVWDGGRLFPRRSRFSMGAVMPWIIKQRPTFQSYAEASLADLFTEDKLQAAQRFEATELRSGVFLSQPKSADGAFRFVPLRRLAQIAPLHGVAAGDFDGDGRADIIAVQNSHAPIPEYGRFAGGLGQLLRGEPAEGEGGFRPVPPAQSGLIIPGDGRALALLDLDRDGWPELLATRHNETALLFGNSGAAGRTPWRIVLRGRAGNPTAIGARVSLVQKDGTIMSQEVRAGGGYWSQNSAACFLACPVSNPARMVRVRWPWGEETESALPAQGGSVMLSAAP